MKPLYWIARKALYTRLKKIRHGQLVLCEHGHRHSFGEPEAPMVAEIEIRDPRFHSAVVFGGHVGAAEAYADGWWHSNQLTDVVRILLRNRDALDGLETGSARLVQPLRKIWHTLNVNTRRGSRRNISAHYDLSNDFFSLILDDTLTYSCGIFEHPAATLRDASIAKYDRICRQLELTPRDHVMEIGTGWGGFAIHAAEEYGCRVTTTTISRRQLALARERIDSAGLAKRVNVLARDYRDLTGTFDKLVSIEMIEAVGHQYFHTFFQKCSDLLVPDGSMALQAITIQPRYYESARDEVDFIKRYIFPGSCIPSVPVLRTAAAATDLRFRASDDIGPHYVETLRRWRANLNTNWHRIRALGFTDQFRRLWDFYFCYCEGGFRERALGNVQMVFDKPRVRKPRRAKTTRTRRAVFA